MADPPKAANFRFWSGGAVEPKRQYKFLVTIPNFQPFLVTKCSRPSLKIGETSHKFLNHTFWYPGTVEWNTVAVTFVDPGDGGGPESDVTHLLYNKLLESGYRSPDQYPGNIERNTIGKGLATKAFDQIKIQTLRTKSTEGSNLNSLTDIAETWTLKNAWATDVKWGDLDYSGDALLQLDVTFRYDYAKLHVHGNATAVSEN
jgi:hypothetical protein